MQIRRNRLWYLAALLAANLSLLLPNAHPLRVAGALLLVALLPGLSWTSCFAAREAPWLRWLIAAALSYAFTTLSAFLIHYLPGPVRTWQLLASLILLALLPLLVTKSLKTPAPSLPRWPAIRAHLPFLLILGVAIFLRAANLSYSEFQGDEALAMIAAAEALEGHEDALFLRSKGPAEVLLPMALWRLTGTTTEAIARLPFTVAALLAIVTIYLIGQAAGNRRVGWLAAGFFAFSGFMVAFGRIVQYQALVVWFSALAFLLLIYWQKSAQYRFVLLGGLSLGVGLLAHYDAILVLPALGWLLVTKNNKGGPTEETDLASGKATKTKNAHPHPPPAATPSPYQGEGGGGGLFTRETLGHRPASFLIRLLLSLIAFTAALLLTTLPFYLPFALDPQANRTGDYVGGRIGSELRNNLPDFFHFNSFYSSFYYIIITGLLVLGLLVWLLGVKRGWQRPAAAVIVAAILGVSLKPDLLAFADSLPDLSFLPFALLLLGAFLWLILDGPSHASSRLWPALLIWLAVPFLGYNFVVALGLTHIYTIVPVWSLLAALGWNQLTVNNEQLVINKNFSTFNFQSLISNLFITAFFLLCTLFLWNAFVLFYSPYQQPPQAGFFGFAHRTGWKAVGQQIAAGPLNGDYSSNEEPDVTTWYTRGAPRACDPQPEFYYLASDLIDPVPVPSELIETNYQQIGRVVLPNQKQMQIMQQRPTTLTLHNLDEARLAREFDQSATPAAFARSARGSQPAQANFGNLVQLVGYDLDTRRAYPGGRIPVTLYWQALAPIPTSYQVFTHLESPPGPVAQSDGVPVCWTYPTDAWRPGQIIADQHAIGLAPDTPPGAYPLEIGLYLPDTFERLDLLDVAGNPAGTSVTLTTVEIGDSALGD